MFPYFNPKPINKLNLWLECLTEIKNIKRPYFIKIKNGANFVDKKYVGESMVDDAKLTIITKQEAIDILGLEVLSI